MNSKKINILIQKIREKIQKEGFEQNDMNLKRKVKALTGYILEIHTPEILSYLKKRSPLKKYKNDYSRMKKSYEKTIKKAKKDSNSRQLMIFNCNNFHQINQCFTQFHFVNNESKNFELYIYQRSSDLSKLIDDLVFFGSLIRKFEKEISTKVVKMTIIYGNIHFERK